MKGFFIISKEKIVWIELLRLKTLEELPLSYLGGHHYLIYDADRENDLKALDTLIDKLSVHLHNIYGDYFNMRELARFIGRNENFFINLRSIIKRNPLRDSKIMLKTVYQINSKIKLVLNKIIVKKSKDISADFEGIKSSIKNYIYSVGYYDKTQNLYYHPIYELASDLALIFKEAGIINKISTRLLEKKVGFSFTRRLYGLKSDTQKGIYYKSFEDLKTLIKLNYEQELKKYDLYDYVDTVFNYFFKSIPSINLIPDEITGTSRGDLLLKLINFFPVDSISSPYMLSNLFFGNPYSLWDPYGKRINPPHYRSILRIKSNLKTLDLKRFKAITGYDLKDSSAIDQIIENCICELNKFSKSNPFESEPEMLVRYLFEELFKSDFKKEYPRFLVRKGINNGDLELDGYNKELKIAFEYDGPQHSELNFWTDVYGYSDAAALERLKEQKINDKIKEEECSKNNIILIRLPHTLSYPNFMDYIRNKYKKLTGIEAPSIGAIDYKNIPKTLKVTLG